MGLTVDKTQYSEADYSRFYERLLQNLKALRLLLDQDGFGVGEQSFGAELEMYLVGEDARAASKNSQLLTVLEDTDFTLELNRYNLEYNYPPLVVAHDAFRQFEKMTITMFDKLYKAGQSLNVRAVPIGILPTLQFDDLGPEAITDQVRYHILSDVLKHLRGDGRPFEIDIDGVEPLKFCSNEITLEGANTSFQFHYRVNPNEFADAFNAAQMATPLLLALGANSPLLLGHKLWQETRIVLFKQAVDCRHIKPDQPRDLPRVNFGNGWVRQGVYELFAESVSMYPPLIPRLFDEDPLACIAAGQAPTLKELRLHEGCIWPWNRPVYDPINGGHLRIELRALPSGPSPIDMIANAAFTLGLIEYLKPRMQSILPALPFNYAENNFYRAAQFGLDAKLIWPVYGQSHPQELPVLDILKNIIGKAEEALLSLGICEVDVKRLIGVIAERLDKRINGAQWQLLMLEKYERECPRYEALQWLTQRYCKEFHSGNPVSHWSLQV